MPLPADWPRAASLSFLNTRLGREGSFSKSKTNTKDRAGFAMTPRMGRVGATSHSIVGSPMPPAGPTGPTAPMGRGGAGALKHARPSISAVGSLRIDTTQVSERKRARARTDSADSRPAEADDGEVGEPAVRAHTARAKGRENNTFALIF